MASVNDIRTGFWLDYDKPWATRALLTVSNTQANFIIAAISFLLASLVLPILWRTLVLVLYLIPFTRPSVRTYELQQRRIILRNAKSPDGALLALAKAFWSWRKGSAKIWRRSPFQFLMLLSLTIASVAVIGAFGIFIPSQFSTDTTNDIIVLAKRGSCGFLRVLNNAPQVDAAAASASRDLDETAYARSYAAQFYGGEPGVSEIQSPYAVLSLPFTVDTAAPCPFREEMCLLGSDASISFDTGLIDSHKHLGINAREEDRIQYRWKSTCTPLRLDGLVSVTEEGRRDGLRICEDQPLADFYLGRQENNNYTFSWMGHNEVTRIGYQVQTTSAYRGFSDARNISWIPIPPLNRTDADVSLIFIAGNLVAYSTAVDDAVFQANGSIKDPIGDPPMYISDFNARIIACADQHEFCNPTNGACSGLNGYLGNVTQPFSSRSMTRQLATALRIQQQGEAYTMERSVKQLGSNALIANSILGNTLLLSPGLPNNQWHLETLRWFQTGLAKLQANTNQFTNVSFTGRDSAAYQLIPAKSFTNISSIDSELDELCSEQRIRSRGSVQNFSVVNLAVLVAVSFILSATTLRITPLKA